MEGAGRGVVKQEVYCLWKEWRSRSRSQRDCPSPLGHRWPGRGGGWPWGQSKWEPVRAGATVRPCPGCSRPSRRPRQSVRDQKPSTGAAGSNSERGIPVGGPGLCLFSSVCGPGSCAGKEARPVWGDGVGTPARKPMAHPVRRRGRQAQLGRADRGACRARGVLTAGPRAGRGPVGAAGPPPGPRAAAAGPGPPCCRGCGGSTAGRSCPARGLLRATRSPCWRRGTAGRSAC